MPQQQKGTLPPTLLLLLPPLTVGVDLEAEGLRGEVLGLGVDEADGPAPGAPWSVHLAAPV